MAAYLKLDPQLDTSHAEALRSILRKEIGHDIVFDISEVELIGALCLELLMSANSLWSSAGKSISIVGESAQLTENLSRFGLTPLDLQTRPIK